MYSMSNYIHEKQHSDIRERGEEEENERISTMFDEIYV